MNKIIFFDTETGGVNPLVHPIIQFAAIVVNEDWQEVETLSLLLRFDPMRAETKALEINHYDPERWGKEAIEPRDAHGQILALLNRHKSVEMISGKSGKPYNVAQLAGHNAASFDDAFLRKLNDDCGKPFFPASFRVLDTLHLASWRFRNAPAGKKPKDLKLGTLCEFFGIALGDEAHDALADVRATAKLAQALTEGAWPE